MTGKRADYVITQVSYSEGHKHIDEVKIFAVGAEEKLISGQLMHREDVISLLDSGKTVITATVKDGKWYEGADVFKEKINEVEYIKTVKDDTEKDNLGELPPF